MRLIEDKVHPPQNNVRRRYHHNVRFGLRHCRFHHVLRAATKLANTAWIVRGHSICRSSLHPQLPKRPYNVIGYLDATTAPIRRRGIVGFAARRVKEPEADAIIVLSQGSEYAGTLTTGNAFTNGNVYPGGFNATTTGTRVFVPLILGRPRSSLSNGGRETHA